MQAGTVSRLRFCKRLRLDGIRALDLWDLIVVVLQREVRAVTHTIQKRKISRNDR